MSAVNGSFALPGGLGLRFAAPTDEDFLLDLFIEARPWLGWAEGNKDFIRDLYESQYKIMRAGQENRYPEHLDMIIQRTGQDVGRLVIDLGHADWRVSEIQILTAARGKGIASDLLRGLQMAAGKSMLPITLSTPMFWFGARSLYERLDFKVVSIDPPHLHLAWFPPGHPMAQGAGHPGA